jgi:hypothetical protein
VAGRKVGWATACRLAPAGKMARMPTATRAPGMLTAWSPCAAHERGGTVMSSTTVRWGLAGGKVLPEGTGGVPGWHRAGGVEAGLTLAAAR